MALLEVENLDVALVSGARILSDVRFTIEPGEVLGVVGESGSGKSMLALSIMGLLPRAVRLTRGRILLDGTDLAMGGAAAWRQRRGRDLAMIFQEPMTALNPVMRVGWQVGEVLVKRRGMQAADARREALALFRRVEIPRAEVMLDAFPHEMSGGMRQRVMIAMALAARARLLIADEPTTALDVTIQAQILALLRNLQHESGLSILFITHDLGVIAEIADRVLVLYGGRVAELAAARTIFDDARHPYTRALLSAVPTVTGPRGHLESVAGSAPSVGAMPPGCPFAPRCPLMRSVCDVAPPPLRMFGESHLTACLEPFGYRVPEQAA
jgi:oligopeptide/dipeptide ABC transporter ATP-binding protein